MRARHRASESARTARHMEHSPETIRRRPPQRAVALPVILSIFLGVAVIGGLFVLFPLDWVKAPSVTVSVEQEAFSPNQDGNQDTAVIMYALAETATVDVHILDDTRSRVRTLLAERSVGWSGQGGGGGGSQHSLVWDGRDDHGKIVMDGQYYVRVAAKGSARQANNTVPLLVDTIPPLIRLANMPEDMRVREQELVIEGVTEPDATVWLNNGPQPVPIDSSGGFRIEHRLQEGENRIELSVTDAAGNRASITRQVALILKPPDIAVDNPPNDLWINQKLLSVQGRVSPGTELTVNGKKAAVDEEGVYQVDILLQEGENLLAFEARDGVGNTSETERRVYLKTRPPAISLTSVKEGMEVREPSLLVVGQTEVGASVRLNGRELAVDSRGGFQSLVNLVEGDNLVKAEVIDRAGNVSTLARRVAYVQPNAPTTPSSARYILPGLVLGVGTILGSWLLLGGWLSPIAIAFAADRPALHPVPDGNADPLLLSLDLSRAAKVTVDVWDANDDLVATLLYKRKRGAGEHVLLWDGYDDGGDFVPYGEYEVEATASTFTTSVSSSVRVRVEPSMPLLAAHRQAEDRTTTSYRPN
jgi:flagellar hook assembly protein FlgD